MLKNKEDIADFIIFSGDNKSEERSYSKWVPYNLRSQTIRNNIIKVEQQISHSIINYINQIIFTDIGFNMYFTTR